MTNDTDFFSLPEEAQERYRSKAAELVSGLLYCNRVWEAWDVGTMTQRDFVDADGDEDIVNDTTEMLYQFVQSERVQQSQTHIAKLLHGQWAEDRQRAINVASCPV